MKYDEIIIGYLYKESISDTLIWECLKEEIYPKKTKIMKLIASASNESLIGSISEDGTIPNDVTKIGPKENYPEYYL